MKQGPSFLLSHEHLLAHVNLQKKEISSSDLNSPGKKGDNVRGLLFVECGMLLKLFFRRQKMAKAFYLYMEGRFLPYPPSSLINPSMEGRLGGSVG